MQCKDIPTIPILEHLQSLSPHWAFNFGEQGDDIRHSFPSGLATPPNLVLAKMAKLIKQGLVSGCTCGCRGDYSITPKGSHLICQDTIALLNQNKN